MKLNWLDHTLAYLSPEAGNRRIMARIKNEQAKKLIRGFDGAANTRRTKNWKAGSASVNAENRPAIVTLRNRARDLVRNEAYAKRAIGVIDSNVVGAGILATAMGRTKGRGVRFQDLWLRWAESTECDFDGRNNFYGLQSLVMSTMCESGEVLVRKIIAPSSEGLTIPLQLQVLEPDFIDTTKDGEVKKDGGFTVQGVEYNARGQRVAYWIWTQHPGDIGLITKNKLESIRVPASDILHIFRTDRAGQVRGITWLAPIMIRMKDHSDWSDATLLRQKLAACFTAFVTEPEALDSLSTTENAEATIGEKLEPGIIEILKPGQTMEFANPPMAADFSGFSREQLRAMAGGIGVTYETLTNDYSQVNFSSGRMGWIEFQRNIDKWRWQILIPHFCSPVWKWFTEVSSILGYGSDPVAAIWTPPRREMIDPAKEIGATKEAIRSGLMSQSEAIRLNGYEPDEVYKELASDMNALQKLGLNLDTNVSINAPQKNAPATKKPVDVEEEDDESEDANQ